VFYSAFLSIQVAEMTRRRKWAAVPALAALAAGATVLAAYSGAQARQAAAPATARATAPAAASAASPQAASAQPQQGTAAAQAGSGTGLPTGGAQTAAPATSTPTFVRGKKGGSEGLDLKPARNTGWGYHGGGINSQGYSPEQPIHFPHPQHVQKLGLNCVYCHYSANKSPDPGMPAVGTCMGCHTVVATGSPEIKKLTAYYTKKQPVPWIRIHKVPEYVHFPHMRHVNAGVTCQSCHGQVQKMNQVYQYSSLNMGWCLNCHVNGYDPAAGDRASGYTKTARGYELQQVASAPRGGLSLVKEANAQTREANPAVSPVPGGNATAGGLRKARYDCSSCHY
jgi:hypothetical protein